MSGSRSSEDSTDAHKTSIPSSPQPGANPPAAGGRSPTTTVTDLDAHEEPPSDPAEEFVARIAHDLSTPLSAMLLWINLLGSQEELTPGTREGLDVIKKAAEEQQALIEALVDLSLITTRKLVLRRRPVDLVLVLRGTAAAVQPQLEARKLVFDDSYDRGVGIVDVDARRLHRVVLNLLGNAIKFTPPGGRVTLRVRREEKEVVIEVTDTGEGIAPEALPGILNRLEQGQERIRGGSGGLGLGLAIGRQVIELHGGSIAVESAGLGHGAQFRVQIPVQNVRSTAGAE